MISFHTDIGTQESTMISPAAFRRHVKPMFRTLFQAVRDAGSLVYLSSDGNITGIVDDLVECGLQAHDPQLRATGLDGHRHGSTRGSSSRTSTSTGRGSRSCRPARSATRSGA